MQHLALVAILAILPAAGAQRWSERRSEPRDQSRTPRHYSNRAVAGIANLYGNCVTLHRARMD
jgi:hypothetical protein